MIRIPYMKFQSLLVILLGTAWSIKGFTPAAENRVIASTHKKIHPQTSTTTPRSSQSFLIGKGLFQTHDHDDTSSTPNGLDLDLDPTTTPSVQAAAAASPRRIRRLWNNLRLRRGGQMPRLSCNLDTLAAAGFDKDTTLVSGPLSRLRQVTKLHNPITYLALSAVAGFRYDWCFRNPYYWFAVGFFIKWYRARYVFKIPVWDRQPNWNNIITSKEQEKDLKAFTCKTCGSTLFIAKTREFFFEGSTGIGGLGCFSCGAKGKDNFVMDRDRIVEDVADVDDYFEYEQPLDFVSRAERRKLLAEAKGDEEAANRLLRERSGGEPENDPSDDGGGGDSSSAGSDTLDVVDATIVEDEGASQAIGGDEVEDAVAQDDESSETTQQEEPKKQVPPPPPPASKPTSTNEDDIDSLGMDDF